jgi:DNA-binding CsgD family transcriptional regulator
MMSASNEALLVAAFAIVGETPDMADTIAKLRDLLGVSHLVYHSSKRGASPSIDPYIRLTYPPEWIKRYLEMNYVEVDPVLREGFLRVLPFDWSELPVSGGKQLAFMADALAHGVGPRGMSIPVRSKHGHRGLVSISDNRTGEEWDHFRRSHLGEIIAIANRLHSRVVHELYGEDRPRVTPREIECLRLKAAGKDSTDIARILAISPHTARDHLKSVRFKLDCATSAQAVSRAISLGILVMSE